MDWFTNIFRVLFGGFFALFGGWPPLATLAPISFLAGVAVLLVFRRVSNQDAIARAKGRLIASLYELRLFADDPRMVWRAQKELLLGNVRYIWLMSRAALILTIPMLFLLIQLDAFYGYSPLPVGKAALVTVQMKDPINLQAPPPVLQAPDGMAVETPAVRVLKERQYSWRVRPLRDASGDLRVVFPDGTVVKSVAAGRSPRYLSSRRASSVFDEFLHPAEPRVRQDGIEWIGVHYPSAELRLWGFEFHWLVWFLLISLASAWFLRKRFGVTF